MGDEPTPSGVEVGELTRVVADRVLERIAKADQGRILLEAIVENIPLGLAVVDQEGRPLVVNSEALHAFGKHDPADFAGWFEGEAYRLDGSRVRPDERPIARTLATGEIVRAELLELVLDDRRAVFEISTAPITGASGERIGGLSIFRDVTVREQVERAERDFVTNAAHELQSPLTAIVSAVEVLQAGAKDGPERDVFLGHIERAADRLGRLVRALLILARAQMGIEPPRDELVALHPLLTEIGSGLNLAPSVELEVECPADLAVVTNRELVERAVVNLSENAAKQTSSGRIVLSAGDADGERVEISVADTGPGIPAADRPRVFERFYRVEGDGRAGFGLGLALVAAAVDALGGEVDVDSRLGAGTTVRLRIPRVASIVIP
jgi:signal transduction histidine kinase